MTHTPGDPQAAEAIRDLHLLLDADPLAVSGDDAESEPVEADLEHVIAAVGWDAMSDEARSLLLRLTDFNENLEPDTRHRLVRAAQRGLEWRRTNSSALPVLLFARRREHGATPDQIAPRAEVDSSVIKGVESGEIALDSMDPHDLARWILALGIAADDAETALRRSFQRRVPLVRAAGSAELLPLDAADEEFVTNVVSAINNLRLS